MRVFNAPSIGTLQSAAAAMLAGKFIKNKITRQIKTLRGKTGGRRPHLFANFMLMTTDKKGRRESSAETTW